MKPTEYMIGDWVKHTNAKTNESYYAKVSGICPVIGSDHKQTGWVVRFHKDGEPLDNPCPVSCEPIPLTTEILDANGFLIDDEDWYIWDKRKGYYTLAEVKLYLDDDVWHAAMFGPEVCEIDDLNIRYVHDLQHAMRLIGLHDFADNFVIEKGGQQ